MLRQLLNAMLGSSKKRALYVPDSEQLPALWPRDRTEHPQPQ